MTPVSSTQEADEPAELPASVARIFEQAAARAAELESPPAAERDDPPAALNREPAPAIPQREAPSEPPLREPPPPEPGPASRRNPPFRQRRRWWPGLLFRFLVIVFSTTALVVSVMRYLGAPRPERDSLAAAPASGGLLGLQVESGSAGLRLTWNQRSPIIVHARRGALAIRDGASHKTLDLDETALETGSIVYTPESDDVEFRLAVYDPAEPPAVQTVRVLSPKPHD